MGGNAGEPWKGGLVEGGPGLKDTLESGPGRFDTLEGGSGRLDTVEGGPGQNDTAGQSGVRHQGRRTQRGQSGVCPQNRRTQQGAEQHAPCALQPSCTTICLKCRAICFMAMLPGPTAAAGLNHALQGMLCFFAKCRGMSDPRHGCLSHCSHCTMLYAAAMVVLSRAVSHGQPSMGSRAKAAPFCVLISSATSVHVPYSVEHQCTAAEPDTRRALLRAPPLPPSL